MFSIIDEFIRISSNLIILNQNICFTRSARESMNEHLQKTFGTTDVPFSDRPILEVKITDALPEAFEKVLHYIYTDRIDCE